MMTANHHQERIRRRTNKWCSAAGSGSVNIPSFAILLIYCCCIVVVVQAFTPSSPFLLRPTTTSTTRSNGLLFLLFETLEGSGDKDGKTVISKESEESQQQQQLFAADDSTTTTWDESLTKAVPLKRPTTTTIEEAPTTMTMMSPKDMMRRNWAVAVVSILLAVGNFCFQYSHPVTSIQLLQDMQAHSSCTSIAVGSGQSGQPGGAQKPTLVDFWAPWCENCKLSAPTLKSVEEEYAGRVNFCMVNGDEASAWPMIEAFRVDAIPHLAMLNEEGVVETALIGPTPKSVLEADLDAMLSHKPVPYTMLDVFAKDPEHAKVTILNE
mmetsp:Transcript_50899/g.76102  ORF Transcript_50899/g.76102 Transcript_50899/m.76102 type:complete len:324 (-) Transcript_50899:160-1131(-)